MMSMMTATVSMMSMMTMTVVQVLLIVWVRDGTRSVTLTRDLTRPGTPVTRDPD